MEEESESDSDSSESDDKSDEMLLSTVNEHNNSDCSAENKVKTKNITILCCIMNVMGVEIATDTYVPALPQMKSIFNMSTEWATFTISCNLVGIAVAGLIGGPISDKIGRKKIVVQSSLVFFMATLACAAAQSSAFFIISRIIQGLSGGAAMVVSSAMVRDKLSEESLAKAMAMLGMIFSLAPGVGPIIGAVVTNKWGWKASFIVTAILAFISFIINMIAPETLEKPKKIDISISGMFLPYIELSGNYKFLAVIIAQAVCIASLWADAGNMPFVFIEYGGMSKINYGILSSLTAVAFMAGAIVSRRSVDKIGVEKMMIMGAISFLATCSVSYIICLLLPLNDVAKVMIKMLSCFSSALFIPNASAFAMTNLKKNIGTATALMEGLQTMLGAFYASIVSTFNNGHFTRILFADVIAGAITLVLIMWSCEIRKNLYKESSLNN